jgi:hypothetical protein
MRIALILIAALAIAGASGANGPASIPDEVRAAFLLNFAKFVEWPAVKGEQAGPLTFCVIGKDPLAEALLRATWGKTIEGRSLVVRQLNDVVAARSCHVLFVSAAQQNRFAEIVAAVRVWSVLTVGESDEFLEQGGIINFFMEARRVRFRINSEAAVRAGLRISSKLLQLAASGADKRKD